MESRPVHRTARSVLFVSLFVLAFLASIPPHPASAHAGRPPKALPLSNALPRSQMDIAGPAGSGAFGTSVTVLPNGNFVVTDPYYSEGGMTYIGAVYLYSGATRTIISTLKGSTANDYVGYGVAVLTNGNFVVVNPSWNNPAGSKADVGAVTWCSATTGCNGVITDANSLIGGTAYDNIGYSGISVSSGVTALTNGNYVVRSANWHNPDGAKVNAGSVTWCSGTSGCNGVVSATNSLVGGTAFDSIGIVGVTALTNGNYVVASPDWTNPAGSISFVGAVTWCSGASGCSGLVSAANSLIGSTANDFVGETAVTALTNGNYVVSSPSWDNSIASKADVGAVTWGNGATGTTGAVTGANSLIGNTASDKVGNAGVLALTNGNYVVPARYWDNPAGPKVDAGSVTWCTGTGGCLGVISAATSLVGGTLNDSVGIAVIPLKNGNYVVTSYLWDNPSPAKVDVGAVTWCSGAGGCSGLVTTANSLVGGTANDQVGGQGVAALTNGNYVVRSPLWDDPTVPTADVGAATWGNGTSGTTGLVTVANSLIGGTASDRIGYTVVALANGNYVVQSPLWDNPGLIADVGAVTWCSGASGCSGLVTTANSLTSGTANDEVGMGSITALTNGNYVVASPYWDNPEGPFVDAGAVTWCSGAGGCSGLVTTANSLTSGTANDWIGLNMTALPNGSYVVRSPFWDNPAVPAVDAVAVTWGNGTGPTTGLVNSARSVLGTVSDGISGFSYDAVRNRLFVGRGLSSLVSILYFANADLQNLALSSGTLSPAFATATTSYTAGVSGSIASLTVSPTAADATANITVNGVAVTSGSASGAITLNVGENIITVVVTAAQDGTTTRTYTVTVTRATPSLNLPLVVR